MVLGAGLRILFRKQRERVQAILAHECAHIDSGDINYVVIAWMLFVGYTLLAVANLVYSQFEFWRLVPGVLPTYEASALGFVRLVHINSSIIFRAGFSSIISILGIWLLLRHFFQLREFRADERAAQAGFRNVLLAAFREVSRAVCKPTWRQLFTMHPSASDRAEHLASVRCWARLDAPFLAGMAFLVARIDNDLPAFGDTSMPRIARTYDELGQDLLNLLQSGEGAFTFGVAIDFALVFIMALHLYRVAAVQGCLVGGVMFRLSHLFSAMLAVFAGLFLGEISSSGELARLAEPSNAWTFRNALDKSVLSGAYYAGLFFYLASAIVLVAPRAMRRKPHSAAAQLVRLLANAGGVVILLLFSVSTIFTALFFTLGGIDPWAIAWLPASNQQPMTGLPSVFQSFVILFAGVGALAVLRWLGVVRPGADRVDAHTGWHTSE